MIPTMDETESSPDSQSLIGFHYGEVMSIAKEIAVDFYWENNLDRKVGYQHFRNEFDSWLKDNKYINAKLNRIVGAQASVATKVDSSTSDDQQKSQSLIDRVKQLEFDEAFLQTEIEDQKAKQESLVKENSQLQDRVKELELCPQWYTKESFRSWLIQNHYNSTIADEISELFSQSLQSAFRKGWEKGYNDFNPEKSSFNYKYYPEFHSATEQRISELEKERDELKGLVELAHCKGWVDSKDPMAGGDWAKKATESWKQFKTENNL